MNNIICNILKTNLSLIKSSIQYREVRVLSKVKHNYSTTSGPTSEKQLEEILRKNFPNASELQVTDVSGGCGAMYEIYIKSTDFKGLSIVKQHQNVYDALKEQIKHIHALNIVTKVPQ